MRLKSIKLAGFKSFVDPTTVPFPGNLSAVVGPNGCGKSNIIDAVRWVMGESSAKYLRGESMADVIFNGSTGRKPVSQASIELIFDNSQGRMGGEYAKYGEIAVKRQVTRDGQSNYFLNSTRCRRKDITQLFLGTGLGPRSYAIIEQGMISRLVEAKPEDLRLFIEEAAGISKYKERRRETELRMRHTRDNLERLEDLQEELTRQLEKLRQQSRSAQKYQAYKAEEREKRGQLLAMQWRDCQATHESAEVEIRQLEVLLESLRTQSTRADSMGVQLQTQFQTQQAHVQKTQQQFYELGTELARIEQTLTHARERHSELNEDLEKTAAELDSIQSHERQDQENLAEAEAQLEDIAPEYEMARETLEAAQETQTEAEDSLLDWQQQWDAFTGRNYELQQKAQVSQSQIKQYESSLQQSQGRHDRLKLEKSALDTSELSAEVSTLEFELDVLRTTEHGLEQQLVQDNAALQAQRQDNAQVAQSLDELKHGLQEKVGRHSAMIALQEAALGQDQGALKKWLDALELDQLPRLAERLDVASGWERAVSVVLDRRLQALCVNDPLQARQAGEQFDSLPGGEISLIELPSTESQDANAIKNAQLPESWEPLGAKAKGAAAWLHNVFCAPDCASAWAHRGSLLAGQSVVSPAGLWLGSNWVVLKSTEDAEDNVLVRQNLIAELSQALEDDRQHISEFEERLSVGREQLHELEERSGQRREQLKICHREIADCRAKLSARQERLEQLTQRRERIEEEFLEIEAQTEEVHRSLQQSRQELAQTVELMDACETEREALKAQEETVRQAVRLAREQVQQSRTRAHELEITFNTLKTNSEAIRTALGRLSGQRQSLAQRREQLEQQLAEHTTPESDVLLRRDELVAERLAVEAELQSQKEALSAVEYELTQCREQRQDADQKILLQQQNLDALRLRSETARVQCRELIKQLEQVDDDMPTVQALVEELPDHANTEQWEQELEQIKQRVARLGPINLAAIEEFSAAEERQMYLSEQKNDVEMAMATLEEAIRRIDKETRDRFKETFDVVNEGLQGLFPKVFGGGSAYLDLTGEDLLETGVAIMARPPGKRNSTIHLLSGGEKALTALALVFSIFQLNPAPFCMLDEVDAPLDDANVGRFCRLVQEMSEEVQFIYISHNKIAMEMAHNLMGVTMHEPGVSRLVAVDVDEAARLAAS